MSSYNVAQKINFAFVIEQIIVVGKEENDGHKHNFLFQQCSRQLQNPFTSG